MRFWLHLTVLSYLGYFGFAKQGPGFYSISPDKIMLKVATDIQATIDCGFTLELTRNKITTHSQMHRTDKYSQNSSVNYVYVYVYVSFIWIWIDITLYRYIV